MKRLRFNSVSIVKGTMNDLLVVRFVDEDGVSYEWCPRWKDLKAITELAVRVEHTNQRVLSTSKKWLKVVGRVSECVELCSALSDEYIDFETLKECFKAWITYLYERQHITKKSRDTLIKILESNSVCDECVEYLNAVCLVCALLKRKGVLPYKEVLNVEKLLSKNGIIAWDWVLKIAKIDKNKNLVLNASWRKIIEWFKDVTSYILSLKPI